MKVNAVLWYRAASPLETVKNVQNWREAVIQAAETLLRDAIGRNSMDSLLKDRETTNAELKATLGRAVTQYGVEIIAVELKDLDIPEGMQRALAREAEALREKRARLVKAEGERDAAAQLAEAAATMAATPGALELRRLQTLSEIGAEHNSTIVIAMPTDAARSAGMTVALAHATGTPAEGQ